MPRLFALALEAGRRITAARMHAAEGLRAVEDAREQIANPHAGSSLPGANCPEDRSKRPRGFSLRMQRAVVHGTHSNTEPVR